MKKKKKKKRQFGHPNNLVGGIPTPLKNMKVNGKDDIPYIIEKKTCLKPPTRK